MLAFGPNAPGLRAPWESTTAAPGWKGYACAAVVAVLVLAVAMAGLLWAELDLVLAAVVAQAAGVLAALTLVPSVRRRAWSGLRWQGWRERTGRGLLAALLLFTVAVQLITAAAYWLFHLRPPSTNLILSLALSAPQPFWQSAALLILVGLVLPLTEEVIFRGILYGGLRRRRISVAVATAVSAGLFGLAHGPIAALPAAALGVGYTLTYEFGRNLLWPWLGHAASNLAVITLQLLVR